MPNSALAEYESAALRICFDAKPDAKDLEKLDGPESRWMVYRRLVRTRLRNMIRAGLSDYFATISEAESRGQLEDFFAEHAVQSHYIRDCVPEFTEYILTKESNSLTSEQRFYLRRDQAMWMVRDLDRQVPSTVDLDLEKPACVNPLHRNIHIPQGLEGEVKGRCNVTVFRDLSSHSVRQMWMNDFAFGLWECWSQPHESAIEAAKEVGNKFGEEIDMNYVERMCSVLAEFVDNGLVLGSLPRE